eukprot:14065376-Alexandrium_andersonii.AAC.1
MPGESAGRPQGSWAIQGRRYHPPSRSAGWPKSSLTGRPCGSARRPRNSRKLAMSGSSEATPNAHLIAL